MAGRRGIFRPCHFRCVAAAYRCAGTHHRRPRVVGSRSCWPKRWTGYRATRRTSRASISAWPTPTLKIVTLSEGEVTHLHVGLKGTMNALFLKDLADKTRRGLRGRIELGKSGGGNTYGYDVVRQFAANGEPMRGDRTINAKEAEVVRRHLPRLRGGKVGEANCYRAEQGWRLCTRWRRVGFQHPQRQCQAQQWHLQQRNVCWSNGLNRQCFIKDPESGKRQARSNPKSEWIVQEVPDLRIFDDELWNAAKARQIATKIKRGDDGQGDENHFRERRRPKYLLSGMTKCACCGGGY